MRKHSCEFSMRFTPEEMEQLNRKAKKAGLPKQVLIRKLVSGYEPVARPPEEYREMMRQLYRIGTNLNQIARKANALGMVDADRYDHAMEEFRAAVLAFSAEATGQR